jgi:hypothetical protein
MLDEAIDYLKSLQLQLQVLKKPNHITSNHMIGFGSSCM